MNTPYAKINTILKFVRENGYVIDNDDKRVNLPEINSKNAALRELTEWTAIEARIKEIK